MEINDSSHFFLPTCMIRRTTSCMHVLLFYQVNWKIVNHDQLIRRTAGISRSNLYLIKGCPLGHALTKGICSHVKNITQSHGLFGKDLPFFFFFVMVVAFKVL